MKIITNWLCAGIAAAFCCSIANAQIIYSNASIGATLLYSNAFNGSSTLNISNTPPNYAVTLFGASNNAVWIDVGGPGDTNALFANGEDGTSQGDSWLLPFNAQSNHVYTLQGTVTFTGNEGSWVTCGYAQHYENFAIASAPWNSSIAAIAWTLRNFTGNTEYFSGPTSGTTIYNNTPPGATGNGTYTYLQILDTTSNKWTTTAYFNGAQLGTPFTYTTIPTVGAIGMGQHVGTTINVVQWKALILFANQLAILQQPASVNVDQGTNFAETVVMGGTPPFAYQWYVNNGAISGATNASYNISSVSAANASTNYYCVITNVYGAVTSSPASLGVYSTPQYLSGNPVTYTNLMTLFGGTNNYLGSSPTFSVFAVGQQPMYYYWYTNSVAVGGATNATFTFTNCQLGGPSTFTCIASNSAGTLATNWVVQYTPTPRAPYPQMVLSNGPVAYWRLDETNYDPNQFNDGEICNDFMSGNNGIYSNVELSLPGYWVTNANGVDVTNDPTETAAVFTSQDYFTGDYAYGLGTNVDFSAVSNAEFTISIWVNGGALYYTSEPQNSGIMVKGYYGTEEFGLDDGAGGGDLRFFLRSAANTLYSASSSVQVGGSNVWFHMVGVCDESNQTATLYINGLRAGLATIPLNSGLLNEAGAPISLGENLSPGNLDSTHQFYGSLDDAAIFPYAMNAGQVAQLYQAAGGVPATLVVPPSTNAAYMTGSTLTISASAFGLPTMGYYWTNVTTGGILESGTTNVEQTLNANLVISNAPASLSGEQLELVITNSSGFSTNFLVTLFSPPAAITLGYTNGILYTNEFFGGNWSIAHQPLTAENMLIGGTNTTWIDVQGTNDTGYMGANGVDNSALGNSWIVPFTPHPGYVYTMSASCTFSGNPGNWVGMGFCQNLSSNLTAARFDDSIGGIDWILWQYNGNVQFPIANDASTFITNVTPFITAGNATHTVQLVLDTTQPQWSQYAWVDGIPAGTNVYTSNPTISAAGITQNAMTAPSENDIQWNYWSLSQVVSGGVPPYLLNPLPPTNSILLTNATITISATGFGSAVLGYYWINNSTIISSGTTNNMAPLPANLSIASTSLSAGQLELVVTNAYGTNITLIPLVSAIPTTGTNITWGVTNGTIYLSWPTSYTGYQLQAETNSLSLGITNDWANVGGSTTTNMVSFPINITNGSVFYRLIYTP